MITSRKLYTKDELENTCRFLLEIRDTEYKNNVIAVKAIDLALAAIDLLPDWKYTYTEQYKKEGVYND